MRWLIERSMKMHDSMVAQQVFQTREVPFTFVAEYWHGAMTIMSLEIAKVEIIPTASAARKSWLLGAAGCH